MPLSHRKWKSPKRPVRVGFVAMLEESVGGPDTTACETAHGLATVATGEMQLVLAPLEHAEHLRGFDQNAAMVFHFHQQLGGEDLLS
jgi:hypothetical protein